MKHTLAEWGNQPVQFALEEDAALLESGLDLDRRPADAVLLDQIGTGDSGAGNWRLAIERFA